MDSPASDIDRAGGPDAVRALIADFVGRISRDFVIGFLFAGKDLERIVRHETELALLQLGGGGAYTGRPIGAVHRALPINRGHFRRRLAFLRTVAREHGVPEDVIERWIDHNQRLEPVVVDGTDCAPEL